MVRNANMNMKSTITVKNATNIKNWKRLKSDTKIMTKKQCSGLGVIRVASIIVLSFILASLTQKTIKEVITNIYPTLLLYISFTATF